MTARDRILKAIDRGQWKIETTKAINGDQTDTYTMDDIGPTIIVEYDADNNYYGADVFDSRGFFTNRYTIEQIIWKIEQLSGGA